MDIKKIVKNFIWKPDNEYNFSIPTSNSQNDTYISDESLNISKNVFADISSNIDFVKSKYNTLINSDIIVRNFTLYVKNKQYKAFLLFIDGLIDSDLINNYILKPLMLKNKANSFTDDEIFKSTKDNKVLIKKIKKFDVAEYIFNSLLPQNSVNKEQDFKNIFSGVNSGNCALFVDTLDFAFDIDVKGFKQRGVSAPTTEVVIKGPQEAFVENLRTNTSLLRRIVNTEELVIENINIGSITKTKCVVCYVKNIANDDLVSEVKYRLNNLKIDSLLSSGQLEQLIVSSDINMGIPETLSTERPDKTSKYLLQGRVVVLVNGSPFAIVMPICLIDFMSSPEDTNLRPYLANFLKSIRVLCALLTLLLPSIYVAVTTFHQEILPTELLNSILSSRESVPFPVIFEILIMEVSFELIREAGLRVPSPIGSTIGIVGALVLGQAAVSANIVSPILIIIVALTGISSFSIPDFIFGFHLRIFRFLFILLGYMAGFLGIAVGLFAYTSVLCNIKSFGISITSPFAPAVDSKKNGYFIPPIWKQEYRATYLEPKKEKAQEKISMKWKYK